MTERTLLDHHARMLALSGITGGVARERGYWSASEPKHLERHFGTTQRRLVPALVLPVHDVRGEVPFSQLRPDEPRVVKGKVSKYEMPAGARMAVDVPPRVRPVLGDPSVPLLVSEGSKKADSAVSVGLHAVDLVGVWNFRGRNGNDGLTALADWEFIALNDRVVFLAFDSDAMQKREVHAALVRFAAFLRKRHAEVRVIYLPTGDGGAKVGLDDYIAAGHGRDDVLALALDELRPLPGGESNGKPYNPPEVDGAELLADVRAFIERFMVLPREEVADLLALWIAHTWTFRVAWATAYLRIVSAAPESGKSLLLEIIAAIARNGWHAVNPSPAVLYRKIDRDAPTLCLDEVDNFPLDEKRDALAVLNAGYRRGATVDRCDERGELLSFNCFCPKVYAGLDTKQLAPALLSRSVTVRLERKARTESVERWIAQFVGQTAEELRDRCAAWAHHNVEALEGAATPELPKSLGDRGCEVWWALLVIAEHIGGDWPQRARSAAVALSAGGDSVDEASPEEQLLADIRDAFGDAETIFTKDLLELLNANDERPWGAKRRGEGLDARGLSRLLRPFKIKPRTIGSGVDSAKGYRFEQFADAFARYLPDPDLSVASVASVACKPQSQADATDATDATDKSPPAPTNGCVDEDVDEPATLLDFEALLKRKRVEGALFCECAAWTAARGYPRTCIECGKEKS